MNGIQSIEKRAASYDMVSALVKASQSFRFEKGIQEKASQAEKELKKMYRKKKSKTKTNVSKDMSGGFKTILSVCSVKLSGKSRYCLLHARAVLILIAKNFRDHVGLTAPPVNRTIIIANRPKAKFREIVTDVSISVRELSYVKLEMDMTVHSP